MQTRDLLFEIGCEELPANTLLDLSYALEKSVAHELSAAELHYSAIEHFATPRRLALIVKELSVLQNPRSIERQGPSVESAYDKGGIPTLACLGFAKSCGATLDDLEVRHTPKGDWLFCVVKQEGKKAAELLPELLNTAIKKLPLGKSMRWGSGDTEFVRPVQWVVVLFGKEVVYTTLSGKSTDRITYGHRFHHPEAISLESADEYLKRLKEAKVLPDFEARRELIRSLLQKSPSQQAHALVDEALLNEVTGLVEWPTLHVGHFDRRFLEIPSEVLICSMKTHQKCFPMINTAGELQPYFLVISNIESKNPLMIVSGNERVINARLNDAEFFYKNDLKHSLESRLPHLKKLIFQKELGSMEEKAQRISELAAGLAKPLNIDVTAAKCAGLLAKSDLLSDMVKEFPELQGVMGYYYALQDKESAECAQAIKEQYQPRFSGDAVPSSNVGALIALVDKTDSLVGIFGIHKKPTGDKDPFALRRAAQGILRILVEKEWSLDLMDLLKTATKAYKIKLPNAKTVEESFEFILERLKAWYLEQGVSVEVFEAVRALSPTDLFDFAQRLQAVREFQQLPEAQSLAAAHKRVNNILKKQTSKITQKIQVVLFEHEAEKKLKAELDEVHKQVSALYADKNYKEALRCLAALKEPIDVFFDQVMIMAEDKKIRENRLALLQALHDLFALVADLSVLSG